MKRQNVNRRVKKQQLLGQDELVRSQWLPSDKGIKVPEDFEIITSDDSQHSLYASKSTNDWANLVWPGATKSMLTKIMYC